MNFKKSNIKPIHILLPVVIGLVVAGFLGFATPTQKAEFTVSVKSGLVGYWNMDEADIYGSTLYDKSGYGNHGTIYGATTVIGKIGQALKFNADDDYVRATGINQISTVYTASAWIYPYAVTGGHADHQQYGYTFLSEDASGRYVLWARVHNGEIRVNTFQSGTDGVVTSGAGITANNWHYVAITAVKGGTSKIYVNGKEVHSWTNGGNSDDWSGDFYIGELRAGRKIVFDGLIDEVRIYNRILTADEVSQNYNASGRAIIDTTDPSRKTIITPASLDE